MRSKTRKTNIIRLYRPVAKVFVHDAFAEGRQARIEALGTRWVLHQANGPRRIEAPEEGDGDTLGIAPGEPAADER